MSKFENLKADNNTIAAVVLNGERYKGKIIADYIVGVDGGYDKTPYCDIFVGDKDSVRGFVSCDKQILLNVEKDESDMETAVNYLLANEIKNMHFYGVLGGRIDHVLANLGIMAKCVQNGINVVAYCNDCDIYMTSDSLNLAVVENSLISLSPFTDTVHIISLEGVKWELFDCDIYKTSSRTISNVAVKKQIQLNVDFGIVMVIVNK